MEFFDVVFGRRSTRRFQQDAPVRRADIDRMVDAARYAPTGYNKQPVRFAVVVSPQKVEEMFAFTGWLTGAPPEGQRPAAYVVVCNDESVGSGTTAPDCATYALMLAAHALGYGSCWHGCRGREAVKKLLRLPEGVEPQVIVSLGVADEPFDVQDPAEDWQVSKDEEGTVHLGKLGRDRVLVREL